MSTIIGCESLGHECDWNGCPNPAHHPVEMRRGIIVEVCCYHEYELNQGNDPDEMFEEDEG